MNKNKFTQIITHQPANRKKTAHRGILHRNHNRHSCLYLAHHKQRMHNRLQRPLSMGGESIGRETPLPRFQYAANTAVPVVL